jgi:Gpi18-like mannosyltransferase
MKKISPIFSLIFLALILRLIFLFPQYSGDVKNHLVWGNSFLLSPDGFYSRHFPGFNDANYPPVAIYLFALSNLLLLGIRNLFLFLNNLLPVFPSFLVPLFDHDNMRFGFLKLPGIIADLGIGLLIFKFFEFRKVRHPYLLASLYFFNPAVIYLSSVWGQIEPITNFFLLLSLYTALQAKTDKSKMLSIVYFVLAALTKQTSLWFAPFYLFVWLKELPLKTIILGVIAAVSLFFASYLPFGLLPFAALKNYLATLGGSSSGVSDAAWNFWFALYPAGAEDSVRLGLFSVRTISIFLLVLILIFFIYRLTKHYSLRTFLKYLFLWSLAVFFLQTRVHERHLAPALVFGLLAFVETPAWWLGYLNLSLFHFLNLFLTLKIPFI